MAFRGRLWVKFNSYKHWAILLSVRPSQGSQREGHSSPNPKENEGKNKCYVSSARNTVPFLTLLNRASQEAEYFRKYICGREQTLGQEFLPCRLGPHSVRIMWCPEMGSVGMPSAVQCGKDCVCQCSHPLHTAFPNLFGPQDLSSFGMLHAMENVFRSYTNRSFSRPNVTTVTSKCHQMSPRWQADSCMLSVSLAMHRVLWPSFLTGE